MRSCRLQWGDSGGEGTAHPDVVKHAKAGEADDVDCRQQYVDGKHRLPAPLCQNAAATDVAIVGSGSVVRVFARKVGAAHAWMGAELTTLMPCAMLHLWIGDVCQGAGACLHNGRIYSPWWLHGAVAAVLL